MRIPVDLLRRCLILAGPTAAGKSAVGLELAERIGAEIIALDSMTLYRGMDIGTAKPSRAERERIPHHLIDILDPHEEYSLAEYLVAAEAACREILGRGKTPLFVGGTGLYLRSLLRGVFDGPPADPEVRQCLEDLARTEGELALHRRLQEVDLATAARLHPHDIRRVIRALEVHQLTGIPLSRQQREAAPLAPGDRPPLVGWLAPPRDWLYDRINRRVEEMFAAGLVEEVRALLDAPQGLGPTARQGLGYREVIEYLNGVHSLAEAITLIQTHTRQFAKRQHTWFRNLEECSPIEITGSESPAELAERLARQISG